MLDNDYIEEIRQLDNRESKTALADYGKTFGIDLKKTKSFDNMLADLQEELQKLADEPLPEENDGVSIADLIQASDENDGTAVFQEASEEAKLLIDSVDNDSIKVIDVVKTDDPKIVFSEPLDIEIPEDLKEKAASEGYEFKVVDSLSDNTIQEAIEHIKASEQKFKLPEEYGPRFSLMGRAPGYLNLPWWIYEWISANADWKDRPTDFPHPTAHDTLFTLIYYINRDGSVNIRETKNSRFVNLK